MKILALETSVYSSQKHRINIIQIMQNYSYNKQENRYTLLTWIFQDILSSEYSKFI